MTDTEIIEQCLEKADALEINLGSEYARKFLAEKIKEELDKADN